MGDLADFINNPNGLNFQNLSPPVQMALMLGLSALLPAALMTMTCFTRVIIVLSFVRQGLGTQNVPPNLVLTGLALFITLFVMQPTFKEIDEKAYQPYLAKQMTGPDALKTGTDIYKKFMLRQTRKQDLALFLHLSKNTTVEAPRTRRS